MNSDEKLRDAEIRTENKLLLRLDNFWYHYKWVTIVVAFFVIVFLFCTLQMCGNEKEDINILYAGPIQLSADEASSLSNVMEFVMPSDFDENGEKSAEIINYQIYSKEQIEKIEAQTDEFEIAGYVDRSHNSKNYDDFYNYIQTGDTSICFLDPWLYEDIKSKDRFIKLSDALGYQPEGALDEYGIKLCDTALYDSYGAMKVLPEDTVVCLLRPLVVGKSRKEEMYAREKEMFAAIVEFNSDDSSDEK
ncbi:MAG: hypothetical protein J6A83_04740 [Clostridia bacterium]|nr:hypothetical protein [Clostridia bacterium]